MKKFLKPLGASALLGSLLLSAMPVANAEPERPQYRLVQLQAEASREVTNNQMQAVLFTELNSANPASLAQEVNRVINSAMQQAAKYPQVSVTTGSQNTHPVYDDKNKLKGWRARAQLELKSTDFRAASDLIAALQNNLQLQSINFSVSDAERKKVETELMIEASQAFQQRAQLIQQAWQANGYELINLDLNTNNYERPPIMYAAMKSRDAGMNIESQDMQGGNSRMRINASGSIQLR